MKIRVVLLNTLLMIFALSMSYMIVYFRCSLGSLLGVPIPPIAAIIENIVFQNSFNIISLNCFTKQFWYYFSSLRNQYKFICSRYWMYFLLESLFPTDTKIVRLSLQHYMHMFTLDALTLSMVRLLSSKAQGWKDFGKTS